MRPVGRGEAAGLPEIQVTPAQGKLLQLLARDRGAHGPGDRHARRLQHDLAGAGPGRRTGAWSRWRTIPARRGGAREHRRAPGLAASWTCASARRSRRCPSSTPRARPFDLVFIDADKANTPEYFEWALGPPRPGSLIVVDNVVRGGAVADRVRPRPGVAGPRRLHEMIAAEPRVERDGDPDRRRQGLRRLQPWPRVRSGGLTDARGSTPPVGPPPFSSADQPLYTLPERPAPERGRRALSDVTASDPWGMARSALLGKAARRLHPARRGDQFPRGDHPLPSYASTQAPAIFLGRPKGRLNTPAARFMGRAGIL